MSGMGRAGRTRHGESGMAGAGAAWDGVESRDGEAGGGSACRAGGVAGGARAGVSGAARNGLAGHVGTGLARHGQTGHGKSGRGEDSTAGVARRGRGTARRVGIGPARTGQDGNVGMGRMGEAGHVGQGEARRGWRGPGGARAWHVWPGMARRGRGENAARQGLASRAWAGAARRGEIWHGESGLTWRGHGWGGSGKSGWHGSARRDLARQAVLGGGRLVGVDPFAGDLGEVGEAGGEVGVVDGQEIGFDQHRQLVDVEQWRHAREVFVGVLLGWVQRLVEFVPDRPFQP